MGSRMKTRVVRVAAILENRLLDLWYARRLLTRVTGGMTRSAKATVSTDYFVIREVFKRVPVSAGDVLVDVGSGQGRVLYFWLRQFPGNRKIGVELNAAIASDLSARLASKVTIVSGNVLDQFPVDGSIFYLFNPFDAATMENFLREVEGLSRPATVVYVFPVHGDLLETRSGWRSELHMLASRLRGIHMRVMIARFRGEA